ncbi:MULTISPECIES: hypothetical protein [unclassified Nocardioides]|uniref:hypothetical protein n=1 Tax=unclassified Nocardioides TaxID=2615069 RepID=UPI00190FC42E|nr:MULTISPECIES: hypothetical protein [unclassified Nocardioides]
MTELLAHTSGRADAIAHLDRTIESSWDELEAALEGHDSFDALAFLRMVAGPWDFSDVRESDSRVETSQAAQDVVGLVLLGMGLPRKPLTGENSGQPDLGKLMGCAGAVIDAASVRALLIGDSVQQPLGSLAGRFLGYELSVRGRQYQSVAEAMNTELFNDPSVTALVSASLGFTLDDARALRDAAVDLLNERFFGARDRSGDLVVRSGGGDLGASDREQLRSDMNLMLNECRLFGAVTASDVADHAGLPEATVRNVLDVFSSKRAASDAADLRYAFVEGRKVSPGGCIADGDEYLILNGFLGEDELRRGIERAMIAAGQGGGLAARAWAKYNRRRAVFSESKAAKAMGLLLAGSPATWCGQKYLGPESLADSGHFGRNADLSGVESREYESDLLVVVDGVALCVEVKAGSLTEKARAGNAKRLATDLEKTLQEGSDQAGRLAHLIGRNEGVWTIDGKWIDLSAVQEIHSIIVMLDDMGPLSLSMNDLATKGVIQSSEIPWIVSMHDLTVLSRVVERPAHFLEYVRRRRGRRLATMVSGADELDLFMWFLSGGMYFELDPSDVAAQLPIEVPEDLHRRRAFDEQVEVRMGTLTDPLDAWFYWTEGLSDTEVPKPTRREEHWVEDFLSASQQSKSPGWLRFGADLVGLSGPAQQSLGREIKAMCRRSRGGERERSLTTHGTTSEGPWLLTACAVPAGVDIDHVPDYVSAKQYQTAASRSMVLLYRTDGRLYGSRFIGHPEVRTVARDAEMEIAPLRSLARTFATVPPSAKRATRQLRGKRSGRKRR